MHIGVVAVVFLMAVFMPVDAGFYAAESSTGTTDEQEKCQTWVQNIHKGHQMEVGFLADGDDELRLKVCGAWPGCTSCVEMSEGDCRYVFPTNVMVYSENKGGTDHICACQVLGCQLPWDPGKWGRKCAVRLGCYAKRSRIEATEFPAALCDGKRRGRWVKFGPIAFTHQTYSQPGVAIITYEGDKIVDTKYMLYPKIMGHRHSDDIGKQLQTAATRASMSSTLSLFNPDERREDGLQKLQVADDKYSLQMYRKNNEVCLRDYGPEERKKEKTSPVTDRCFPIPDAPIPVLYAREGPVGMMPLSKYIEKRKLLQERRVAYTDLQNELRKKVLLQNMRIECDSNKDVAGAPAVEQQTVVGAVEDHEYEDADKCDLVKSPSARTVAMHSGNTGVSVSRIGSLVLRRKLENNGGDYKRLVDCGWFQNLTPDFYNWCVSPTERRMLSAALESTYQEVKVKKYGGIYKFPGYAMGDPSCFYDNMGIKTAGSIIKNGTFYGDYNGDSGSLRCRFAKAHVREKVYDEKQATCEYMEAVEPHTTKKYVDDMAGKSVLCPYGILNIDHQEYEVLNAAYCEPDKYCEFAIKGRNGVSHESGSATQLLSLGKSMMKYVRIRVKKKPKSLRRYAVVNSNGIHKRIRCDDRYSIDLYTVSQEVLNNSDVRGNRFLFPREYLGQSVSDDSDDPCHSTRSKIVYYYEHGGFVEGEDAKVKCGNPVEEYYAPNKKIVGCEYDYVRTDDYKPFLQGLDSADSISVVPLSRYEQGICIDNFEKTWFLPTYLNDPDKMNKRFKNSAQLKCCKWDAAGQVSFESRQGMSGVVVRGSGNSRSRYEYAYNISPDVHIADSRCTLYKIEMWGGGEVASYTSEMGKRSGRPGQYVMLALDLGSLKSSENSGEVDIITREDGREESCRSTEHRAFAGECIKKKVESANQHFLVMKIGRGGKQGGSHGNEGKGGNTILKLCGNLRETPSSNVNSQWRYDDSGAKKKRVQWQVCGGIGGACRTKEVELNDREDCYEIARAVGGGSEKVKEPSYAMAKDIMVYYRTIYGDVLAGDDASIGLLESHSAMFTKFSLEMNLKEDNGGMEDPILKIVNNRRYFEGRSLPRQFCRWKARRSTPKEDEYALIPGMGGCWRSAANKVEGSMPDVQGVGEDGAVMITCERWQKIDNSVAK